MAALSTSLKELVKKRMVNGLWPNALETQGSWSLMMPVNLWRDLKLRRVVRSLFRKIDIVIDYNGSLLDFVLMHVL
jgi:hypothetical protein